MSDLIRRQDAIDALKKIMFTHLFECGEYIGEDTREVSIMNAEKALDVIKNLPSAEPEPKWIPVTERLPEEETDVLVTVHFDGYKSEYTYYPPSDYVEIASHIEGVWSSLSDEYKVVEVNHHVVAWAKLPEPWKGEE